METFAFRVKDQQSCLLETGVKKVPKSESPNHYILSTGLIFPDEGFFFVASRLAGFRRFPLKNEQDKWSPGQIESLKSSKRWFGILGCIVARS